MNQLLDSLLEHGFKAKMKNNIIYVNLSFFSFPVAIAHNIPMNCYELKLQYWRYALLTMLFLINLLQNLSDENLVFSILFGALVVGFPISTLVVHHKSRALKDYIDSINGE
ncbi:hypothetical protein KP803_15695 [Vibrio sp. ZSDE26]|uniref:Uncharacterized protein n=1 Tax=Vibrio amylolyticus TaxID=2847292 RepID=A0A9X1XMQ9_9VIBR|nr:hypothetical protein [Vibrio amylolyticus]MCK6264723.1 hypothetical protein [Vibrio amylolyticus]